LRILILLLTPLAIFGKSYCITEIKNPSDDPYLEYALLRAVEKAIIESGYSLSCEGEYEKVLLKVTEFNQIPIAYTPEQRINLYNLSLRLKVAFGEREFTVSSTVPYSLPSGSTGDIPRRKAIDDLTDKIYSYILQNIRR
jgi:hypothetical protein